MSLALEDSKARGVVAPQDRFCLSLRWTTAKKSRAVCAALVRTGDAYWVTFRVRITVWTRAWPVLLVPLAVTLTR